MAETGRVKRVFFCEMSCFLQGCKGVLYRAGRFLLFNLSNKDDAFKQLVYHKPTLVLTPDGYPEAAPSFF